ncbi:MAG: DUF6473 family protein [Pseudomonadota bacterium]
MGIGYQKVDRTAYDYDIWFVNGGTVGFRGPPLRLDQPGYVSFIGAAQTFGRFVHDPFSRQVGRFLTVPAANLGISGAGPEYYLRDAHIMGMLRNSSHTFVQAMSGRSVSAAYFQVAFNNGVSVFQSGPREGERMLAQKAYELLRREYGEEAFQDQVQAVRLAWVERYVEIIEALGRRASIVWISERSIDKPVDLTSSPLGIFPHFVDRAMIDDVCQRTEVDCIECVMSPMLADPIVNKKSGRLDAVFGAEQFPTRPDEMRALNNYYATNALHDITAREILKYMLSHKDAFSAVLTAT